MATYKVTPNSFNSLKELFEIKYEKRPLPKNLIYEGPRKRKGLRILKRHLGKIEKSRKKEYLDYNRELKKDLLENKTLDNKKISVDRAFTGTVKPIYFERSKKLIHTDQNAILKMFPNIKLLDFSQIRYYPHLYEWFIEEKEKIYLKESRLRPLYGKDFDEVENKKKFIWLEIDKFREEIEKIKGGLMLGEFNPEEKSIKKVLIKDFQTFLEILENRAFNLSHNSTKKKKVTIREIITPMIVAGESFNMNKIKNLIDKYSLCPKSKDPVNTVHTEWKKIKRIIKESENL